MRIFIVALTVLLLGNVNSVYADSPAGHGGLRFGYTRGFYRFSMSGPEIYMWRINNGYVPENLLVLAIKEVKEPFGQLNQFNSFQAYTEFEGSGLTAEAGLAVRRSSTEAVYTVITPGGAEEEWREKVKLRYNEIFLTVGYRAPQSKLYLGVGLDIGMFSALHKINDSKWSPWFYAFKIFGGDITARTPCAAVSLVASYDISYFTLRVYSQHAMMNPTLNSDSGKYTNIPWSTKVFPIAHFGVGLMFHIGGE